jgi:2',3'-cyclic-nucleotide 2'-phosphodiesterase (5'-nucleotidase family)
VSGIAIEATLGRPPGERVTAIRVGGAPLDDSKLYTVAVNDFIARGGDGYAMFVNAARQLADSDAPLLANEVMVYLRKLGAVTTGVEGRMVVK